MKNRSSDKTLSVAFALLMIIGLSGNVLALSDSEPQYASQPKMDSSLVAGADRVPVAMMFTGAGTSWDVARQKALKAASSYYRGAPFKVVSESREFVRFPFVRERYRVTIWTIPCL